MTKRFVGKFICEDAIVTNKSNDREIIYEIRIPVRTRTDFKDDEKDRDRD